MKSLTIIFISACLVLTSCKKSDCNKETDNPKITNPVCSETPPTNEACAAYFLRWFYNAGTNSCSQVGYSGCSQKGFATQQECEACK